MTPTPQNPAYLPKRRAVIKVPELEMMAWPKENVVDPMRDYVTRAQASVRDEWERIIRERLEEELRKHGFMRTNYVYSFPQFEKFCKEHVLVVLAAPENGMHHLFYSHTGGTPDTYLFSYSDVMVTEHSKENAAMFRITIG